MAGTSDHPVCCLNNPGKWKKPWLLHHHHQTWHVLESFALNCCCFPKRECCTFETLAWKFKSLSWILSCKAVIWCEAGNALNNFSFGFWSLCCPPVLPLGCHTCFLHRLFAGLSGLRVIICFIYSYITVTLILWIWLKSLEWFCHKLICILFFSFSPCTLFFPLFGYLGKGRYCQIFPPYAVVWEAWVKIYRLVTHNYQWCKRERAIQN